MSEDILDTIDGALADWETSDDAMRWVPPENQTEQPEPQQRWYFDGEGRPTFEPLHFEPLPVPEVREGDHLAVVDPAGSVIACFVVGQVVRRDDSLTFRFRIEDPAPENGD